MFGNGLLTTLASLPKRQRQNQMKKMATKTNTADIKWPYTNTQIFSGLKHSFFVYASVLF